MPHTLADAFLDRIPKGAIPIVDALNAFQKISDDFGEKQKVNKQGTAEAAPQPTPPIPQIAQPQQPLPQQPQAPQQSQISELLKRLLIPGGAAIAGSVNPNLLPQAAGLAGGFTKEIQRQDVSRAKLGAAEERKVEAKRKERRRNAEKIVELSRESFPPESVNSIIRAISEAESKLGTGSPGAAAIKARKTIESKLPKGVKEEDVNFTMKKHNLSREEVIKRLKK